jgi:hypothetical protein
MKGQPVRGKCYNCKNLGYGLESLDSIPSRGKIFLFSIACSRALGPTQHPIQWVKKGKVVPVLN